MIMLPDMVECWTIWLGQIIARHKSINELTAQKGSRTMINQHGSGSNTINDRLACPSRNKSIKNRSAQSSSKSIIDWTDTPRSKSEIGQWMICQTIPSDRCGECVPAMATSNGRSPASNLQHFVKINYFTSKPPFTCTCILKFWLNFSLTGWT